MSQELVMYDGKYELKSYETLFIQSFKDTHNLSKSLKLLTNSQQDKVNASLRTGKSDLAKAFKEFVEEAPIHPEANKVVILDSLVWIMNQAKEDKDTNGVLRAITEINKMIKDEQQKVSDIRKFLDQIYNQTEGEKADLKSFSDEEIMELAHNLRDGVPIATPVFDGIKESELKELLVLADLPASGQTTLVDGRTDRKGVE